MIDNKEDNILDVYIDKEEEEAIWRKISEVDGAAQYFKMTLDKDIRRFFNTPKEQQDLVKGAFSRTKYFYDLCVRLSQ